MTAQELVSQVKDLPPVSPEAVTLVTLLEQPEVRNEDIVNLLKFDSGLTTNLLRICNSPTLALREQVGSLDQAVLLLGHQQILRLVLSICFGTSMAAPLTGYAVDPRELWRHSLITALAAEAVCHYSSRVTFEPAFAFTAGLLHDVGKLVINQVLTPQAQAAIRARIEHEGRSRPAAERDVLQTDHAEVGGCLLERWRLPELIVEAVRNHHKPVIQPRLALSAVIHVANCLAHQIGSAPGWESYAIQADSVAAEALGLKVDDLDDLLIKVFGSLNQAESLAVAT